MSTKESTLSTSSTVGNWGRWGADDERGTLNLLTPDVVLAATQVPRTGKVYSLGLPIQREGVPVFDYRGAPQRLTLTSQTDVGMYDGYGAAPGVGANEDVLVIASHSITHMDALCHVFADQKHYNGHDANGFASHTGAPRCGIEKTQGFAGRGVLLDIAALQEVDWVEPGYVVTGTDLEDAARAEGVGMRSGDILLLHTGWLKRFAQLPEPKEPGYAQPGLGRDACDFVRDHDVAAVGADNAAIEVIPFDRGVFLNVHIELLVKGGITLMEHLRLAEMADDRCYESLFMVGPLLVTGATGSPVNPIAIG